PLPPLDGGRIVYSLLPNHMAAQYGKIEPYGLLILIVLMFAGVLGFLLQPLLLFGHMIICWFIKSRCLARCDATNPLNLCSLFVLGRFRPCCIRSLSYGQPRFCSSCFPRQLGRPCYAHAC